MYEPAPPRRKKTNIVRSRNGCQSCRQKRRKCDEAKPICERCQKLGLQCHYSGQAPLQFHDATDWTFNKIHKAKKSALAGRPAIVTCAAPPAASVVARSTCDQTEPNTELQDQTIDPYGEEAANCQFTPPGPYLDSGLLDIFRDIPYLPSLSLDMPVADARQYSQSFADPFLSITGDYERSTNASSHLFAQHTPSLLNFPEPNSPSGLDAAHLTCPSCYFVPGLIPFPTPNPLFSKTPDTDLLSSAASESPDVLFPQGYTKEAAALASSPTICPSVKQAYRIFLAHFLTSVYDLIPGRDPALRQLVVQVEGVQMAAMALAAANLANVEGAYAYSANGTRQSWIPKKAYVDESLVFANQVGSLTGGSLLDSRAAIAIRLLLAYRELEVGTIRNLILQTVAIERALINMNEDLATNPENFWIWRATINIRALLRATIGPFQRVDSETLHQRAITSLDAHFSTDPHLIHYLVASAIHISTRIILSRTLGEGCKDPEKLARKISEWHAIMLGMGNLPDMRTPDADMDMHLTEDRLFEHLELLEGQARLVRPGVSDFQRELLPYLTQDDPIEVPHNVDYMSTEPLEPGDHETTMTAALYIFAQIICSSNLLRNMLDGAESQFPGARWNPTDNDRSRPWLQLLLRVARGLALRPADLPRRNTYRRGITPMLFFAAVRYRDVRILNFLDNFLADMDRAGVAWEDIQSPVSLIRLTIGIVQREIGAGRTIFKVGSTFAYTRSLKDMVVTDTDELLVLHGRNEHGKYFNKAVPFQMGKRGDDVDSGSAL